MKTQAITLFSNAVAAGLRSTNQDICAPRRLPLINLIQNLFTTAQLLECIYTAVMIQPLTQKGEAFRKLRTGDHIYFHHDAREAAST